MVSGAVRDKYRTAKRNKNVIKAPEEGTLSLF
jgi:hypothetical protein